MRDFKDNGSNKPNIKEQRGHHEENEMPQSRMAANGAHKYGLKMGREVGDKLQIWRVH